MTNLEYLQTVLGKFGLSESELNVILLENGINPNDTITEFGTVKTAIYKQIPLLIAGIQDVSEGGYSIKWNLEGIKLWYSVLAKELGLPNLLTPKPTIKSVKPW